MNTLACQGNGNSLYASLSGSDHNPGTEEEPFATLAKARDRIRDVKEAGSLPQGGITVNIRGGAYPITGTFRLTSEDSGTALAPITWRAHPAEVVRFSGEE